MKTISCLYLHACYWLSLSSVDARFESVSSVEAAGGPVDDGLTNDCDTSVDGTCRAHGSSNQWKNNEQQVDDNDGECVDQDPSCQKLFGASIAGECIRKFSTMRHTCRKTCQLCGDDNDNSDNKKQDDHQRQYIKRIYNQKDQEIQGRPSHPVRDLIAKVDDYMYNQVYVHPQFDGVGSRCKNKHELCIFWAELGECEANPKYMQMQCAPACRSCDQLSLELRCTFDDTAPTIWSKPGDLNGMFQRIVTSPEFAQYNPTILSQPYSNVSTIHSGPWVVVLDDFLTPKECETLKKLGALQGYERSKDVGAQQSDGTYGAKTSTGRTSTNAWCLDACWEHEVTQTVHRRMENLIQVPMENYEYLQLLQYEEGQFYEQHHDYIFHHKERSPGVRILTIFLYLNDVEEGGGTNFPYVNDTTVMPKMGRALIWPSVHDANPNMKDRRTDHQALPVVAGVKYGANAWVHQRDFKEAWARQCH